MDPFAVVCHLLYHTYIHQLTHTHTSTHTPHTHTHTSHHTHTCTHTHKQRYDPAVNYDSGSDDEDFEPNNVSVTHT